MSTTDRKLRVFLSHSTADKLIVRELCQRLSDEGWIDPWLDKEKLLVGQDFDLEIEKAVETSDAVIVFISSSSVKKPGYVQKELRLIYDIAMFKPEGMIFSIPLRLENCEPPPRFRHWHWGDYFGEEKDSTYKNLLQSLNFTYRQILQIENVEKNRKEAEESALADRLTHRQENKCEKEAPLREIEDKTRSKTTRSSKLNKQKLAQISGQEKTLRKQEQEIQEAEDIASRPVQLGETVAEPNNRGEWDKTGNTKLKWSLDSTGFPMIYIEPIELWMQALPVTTQQYNIFIRKNRLLVPGAKSQIRKKRNLEDYLVTDITYKDAQYYAQWCGKTYLLPEVKVWREAYTWLGTQPTYLKPDNWQEFSKPAKLFWTQILRICAPTSLLEQTLMSEGVLEWAINTDSVPYRAGGLGKPFRRLWQVLRTPTDNPVYPKSDLSAFGFRLFRREE